jgi:hypothetical protein
MNYHVCHLAYRPLLIKTPVLKRKLRSTMTGTHTSTRLKSNPVPSACKYNISLNGTEADGVVSLFHATESKAGWIPDLRRADNLITY